MMPVQLLMEVNARVNAGLGMMSVGNDAGNNDAGNECWDYFRLECCWAFSTTLSIASF